LKTLDICSISDIGIRPANEDAYLVSRLASISGELTLLAVADGLGGHPAGEVASQFAVRALERIVQEQLLTMQAIDTETLCGLMSSAFQETNRTISRLAEAHTEWSGMATTLVAALISPEDICIIGNVGDSRAYRISGNLERLTRDHSRVQELVEGGFISPDEAEHHPHRNIVTRIVGREGDSPDIFTCQIGYSILLLCSDGLFDGLSEKEILSVATEAEFPILCNTLVSKAKQTSRDNITVVAAKWSVKAGN
jgi:serine/threonine protein phosphatase PrpC